MTRTYVVFAVLRSALKQPMFWLLVAALLATWRGLEHFMPLGLSTDGLHRSVGHYEVAFMGGAFAMLLVLGPLRRLEPIVRPTGPLERTLLEAAGLMAVALTVGLFVLVPAHALHLWQFEAFHPGRSLLAGAIGWSHLTMILVAITLRGGPGAVAGHPVLPATLAIGLAFLVPGWLTGASGLGRGLLTTLDVGGILRTSFDFPPTRAHWLQACLPIVGWGAVAAALAAPARSPDTAHAIRDPR